MLITKIFTFEAAHKLPNYPGKCSELHGHAWKLMIGIKGDIDKDNGMIIDFLEIPKIKKSINIAIINNITIYKGLNLYPKLFNSNPFLLIENVSFIL